MSKGQAKKQDEATPTTLTASLEKVSSSGSWFKLSKETKSEFKKAKIDEVESQKAGFVLGGSLKQVI